MAAVIGAAEEKSGVPAISIVPLESRSAPDHFACMPEMNTHVL
jgi:hypothetical protein